MITIPLERIRKLSHPFTMMMILMLCILQTWKHPNSPSIMWTKLFLRFSFCGLVKIAGARRGDI